MMAVFTILIFLLAFLDPRISNCIWTHSRGISENDLYLQENSEKGTCSIMLQKTEQLPTQLDHDISFMPVLPRDFPKLQSTLALHTYFICPFNGGFSSGSTYQSFEPKSKVKQRLLIVLLLFLSGNVQPNPGPELQYSQTPSDFKIMSGVKYIHLNVRSLLLKMDMVKIWVKSTDADVVIISETWLTKSITNEDINIYGYNVYRTDRPKKGGGVAIYVKSRFHASIVLSQSICKQMEFLALNVDIANTLSITIVGCYRPPSASKEALSSLKHLLAKLNYTELLMAGDLNWDWLNATSGEFKEFCDSVNLTQLVYLPTRPNLKCPEKSTLIDLVLTNVPHKFSSLGVFCNDLSDHCVVAVCTNAKIPKCKPRIVCKRNLKQFNEQAFHHDLSVVNWEKIGLLPDVELAWTYFKESFMEIVNKHAPLRKVRIKGRENPWFSQTLADNIHKRNRAWDKARQTDTSTDWSVFKQLRNKCTSLIKKAKSEYFLSVTTENLNDPQKFWKVIKSFSANKMTQTFPKFVVKDSVSINDKTEILNCFNEHFLSVGSLFDSAETFF
ncbi:uncharacterized protein LOC109204916 [Oreochromis niloticus]|uniref:uncharacterized protein LOC109204916 n=1 Tax=Oreochromis niloticus TaxID=8128 RepID=UPI000904E261|nr:uncharacterized protein LOC109204916 [Oreochromis niloticus]